MEGIIKIIVPLLVGAMIGYVTNSIAIKMLFHPRKAYYIGKFRVPFTPGLIPKEKKRIARSLGRAVSGQLLNSEILRKSLTSKEMTDKICSGIISVSDKNRDNQATLRELLQKIMSEEGLERALDKGKESLVKLIETKLAEADLAGKISEKAEKTIKDTIGKNVPFFSRFVSDETIGAIAGGIGNTAQSVIVHNAPGMLEEMTDKEADEILNMHICDFIEKIDGRMQTYLDMLTEIYVKIIDENIDRLLNAVDLAKTVEERVDSFDVEELEDLIFGIMKKELNAIVYLGALLGFLMGFANILLNALL